MEDEVEVLAQGKTTNTLRHASWLMVVALRCVRPQFQWYHLAYATEIKSWLYRKAQPKDGSRTISPQTITPRTISPGQYPPDNIPPGQYPPGQYPPLQYPPNPKPNPNGGTVKGGILSRGYIVRGDIFRGEYCPGGVVRGDIALIPQKIVSFTLHYITYRG